jgi:hypothetical protein
MTVVIKCPVFFFGNGKVRCPSSHDIFISSSAYMLQATNIERVNNDLVLEETHAYFSWFTFYVFYCLLHISTVLNKNLGQYLMHKKNQVGGEKKC